MTNFDQKIGLDWNSGWRYLFLLEIWMKLSVVSISKLQLSGDRMIQQAFAISIPNSFGRLKVWTRKSRLLIPSWATVTFICYEILSPVYTSADRVVKMRHGSARAADIAMDPHPLLTRSDRLLVVPVVLRDDLLYDVSGDLSRLDEEEDVLTRGGEKPDDLNLTFTDDEDVEANLRQQGHDMSKMWVHKRGSRGKDQGFIPRRDVRWPNLMRIRWFHWTPRLSQENREKAFKTEICMASIF